MTKLTPEQFGEIARRLPDLRTHSKELASLIKSKPKQVKEFFGNSISWAAIYERSFVEQIAYLLVLIGMHKPFIEAMSSGNPVQGTIDLMDENSALDKWYADNEEKLNKTHFLWMVVTLQKNISSIMLHHQSLGSLVAQVREGSDEAFFKAVLIDRTILTCPTFSDRLARAELTNDKDFFIHLRRAIKGPSKKHMVTIGDLRYGIVLLREAGFDSFTDQQLIDFFVSTGMYPKNVSAAKNLRKHIQVAKNFSIT